MNRLFYGDNLDILRDQKKIKEESVDLCYIDPPFNSKRNYNQIYNNIGGEDRAQAQAFTDTWTWDDLADSGFTEIIGNAEGRFAPQLVELIKGLHGVLRHGSLLAYLVSISLRVTEIHRVLKPGGFFYLHCDPTASHYLKLVLDATFCSRGGDYLNEIIWRRTGSHNKSKRFGPIHDVILFYVKAGSFRFRTVYGPYLRGHVESYFKQSDERGRYWTNALTGAGVRHGESGAVWRGYNPTARARHWAVPGKILDELGIDPDFKTIAKLDAIADAGFVDFPAKDSDAMPTYKQYLADSPGMPIQDIWCYQPHTKGTLYESNACIDEDVRWLSAQGDSERLGYQTQKPEGLLERMICASSDEGQTVLDAYCGCGTTVAVAQRLKRNWIGIDITYASISVVLRRLEDTFGTGILSGIKTDGIPRDIASAIALAHKKDDRLRKEFEKWAILSYTNNRATINDKKGADAGIDGIGYFLTAKNDNAKIIFQVKSGGVKRGDIATLRGDMGRENAALAILITLEEPSGPMVREAKAAGQYRHEVMGRNYDRIGIVTAQELIDGKRLDLPMSVEVVKAAQKATGSDEQMTLL